MAEKTFGLIICDKKDFLRAKGEVIQTVAMNHAVALGYFTNNFTAELLNKTIMTFCFEHQKQCYGYEFVVINNK